MRSTTLGQGTTVSRRSVLALVPGLVALHASTALAQRAVGPARIGWVSYVGQPDPGVEKLRLGLGELGHVEGKSYVLIPRYANGDFTRIPLLVDELMVERIDVLVSRGPTVDYLIPVRSRVPIVFSYSGDPVAAGFADSLARPGHNMTGITFMALELSAKRVEVLKELVPSAMRMALLSNPEHAGELAEYRVTEDAARRVGSTIVRHLARTPASPDGARGHPREPPRGHARVPGFPDAGPASGDRGVREPRVYPRDVRVEGIHRRGWPRQLRAGRVRQLQGHGEVRGEDPQGRRREPGADRAREPDRADDQPGRRAPHRP